MKTFKNLIAVILITLSLSAFAFIKPENLYNSNQNFGINDTIDTLKSERPRFQSVMDDDLDNSQKNLENSQYRLNGANIVDSLLNGKPNPPKK